MKLLFDLRHCFQILLNLGPILHSLSDMLPTWDTLSEDEMVDRSLHAESGSILLDAGRVTGAVLPFFFVAIILGLIFCGLKNGSLEWAFSLLSEISIVDRVVCRFHCKTHGERQGHNLTV